MFQTGSIYNGDFKKKNCKIIYYNGDSMFPVGIFTANV